MYTYVFKYPERLHALMPKAKRTHGTVSLPVQLLEEVDKVLEKGLMGFRSRAELVAEATRAYLRDLRSMSGGKAE